MNSEIPQGQALVAQDETGRQLERPFFFLATFWGKQYRDWFCFYAVQSLLSPNNIQGLSRPGYARFLICTTPDDWEALQKESVFQQLRKQIDVVFIENDELFPGEHKYHRMSRGHAMLADECFKYSAIAININPDSIYPDGCVAEAERLAQEGKDVVLCAAVRFEMEGIRDELAKSGTLHWGHPLVLPMRNAVRLGLKYLHPETRASEWQAPNFGRLAAQHERTHLLTCCIWRVPEEPGCIVVTHNWSPFLVNYAALQHHNADSLDGRAIDGDYIYENFGDGGEKNNIHVVEDSDSIFLLGLTPKHEMVPPGTSNWWKKIPIISQWSRGYILNQTAFDATMDPLKRRLYRTKVRWHDYDFSPRWKSVERLATKCLSRYVSNDLAKKFSWSNPLRSLWYRATHTDMFRPYGAPSRSQILIRRLKEVAKKGKPYIYLRAAFLAYKGDSVARTRIRRRSGKLALLSLTFVSGLLIAFALLNFASYLFIEYVSPPKTDRVHAGTSLEDEAVEIRTGKYNILYESGWDDSFVEALFDMPQQSALVLGNTSAGFSGTTADQTIAANLNRLMPQGSPVFLTAVASQTNFQVEINRLINLLQSHYRPRDVVILTSWQEILSAVDGDQFARKGAEPSAASSIASLWRSLPLFQVTSHLSLEKIVKLEFSAPINNSVFQSEKVSEFFASNHSVAEKLRLRKTVRASFKKNLDFLSDLAEGFGFRVWVFHQPLPLSDPNNAYVPESVRSSDAFEFIVVLNEGLRQVVNSNKSRRFDLSAVLHGGDGSYYSSADSYSPAANQRIAQAIADIMKAEIR